MSNTPKMSHLINQYPVRILTEPEIIEFAGFISTNWKKSYVIQELKSLQDLMKSDMTGLSDDSKFLYRERLITQFTNLKNVLNYL